MQTVLCLGWDPYVIRALDALDISSVVVTDHWGADNLDMSERPATRTVLTDDHTRPDQVLSALRRSGLAAEEFAAVLTTDEYSVVPAAIVGELLRVPATSTTAAILMRDKMAQNAAVHEAGVPVARSVLLEDVHDLGDMDRLPFDQGVVKPLTGGGTESTFRVDSVEELRSRLDKVEFHRRPSRQFLLEEYQPGEEWHVNGIVRNGRLEFYLLFTYQEPCLSKAESNGRLLSTVLPPGDAAEEYRLVDKTVRRSLEALEYDNGVFHLELFVDRERDSVTFGECAARRGGGLIQEAVQVAAGVDLAREHVLSILGTSAEIRAEDGPHAGYVALPPQDGILLEHRGRDEVLARPGVRHVVFEQQIGQPSDSRQWNTYARLGQVLVVGDSRQEVVDRLESTESWFAEAVVTLPSQPPTTRALRQWRRENDGAVVGRGRPVESSSLL